MKNILKIRRNKHDITITILNHFSNRDYTINNMGVSCCAIYLFYNNSLARGICTKKIEKRGRETKTTKKKEE